jgi:hypothetical protein
VHIEDWIASDQQRVHLVLGEHYEGAFDCLLVACFHNAKVETQRLRRPAHVGRMSPPLRGIGVDQGSKSGRVRNKLAQQPKPFRREVGGNDRHSRGVAIGTSKG